MVLIKASKDCCNILITAATRPLNPFTVEQSGVCDPRFLALRSEQYAAAYPCQDYFKTPTIRQTKEEELERAVDIEYQGCFD